MTETAKERIEEEIKDVNRSLVYSLNKNGRAFNSGKRQGLTIALAHVENASKSQHSKLSIPKKIAEELEELTGKTNWESTPYSVIEEKGKINTWAYLGHGKCSEQLYKFCRDNTRLMHAYLNPLTRPFVEVTDE